MWLFRLGRVSSKPSRLPNLNLAAASRRSTSSRFVTLPAEVSISTSTSSSFSSTSSSSSSSSFASFRYCNSSSSTKQMNMLLLSQPNMCSQRIRSVYPYSQSIVNSRIYGVTVRDFASTNGGNDSSSNSCSSGFGNAWTTMTTTTTTTTTTSKASRGGGRHKTQIKNTKPIVGTAIGASMQTGKIAAAGLGAMLAAAASITGNNTSASDSAGASSADASDAAGGGGGGNGMMTLSQTAFSVAAMLEECNDIYADVPLKQLMLLILSKMQEEAHRLSAIKDQNHSNVEALKTTGVVPGASYQVDAARCQELLQHAILAKAAYARNDIAIEDTIRDVGYRVVTANCSPSPWKPGFYVGFNTEEKVVVLSIRGTQSLADLVTDISAAAVPLLEQKNRMLMAHAGMSLSANWVLARTLPLLRDVFVPAGWSVLVVGHSLGAGTAALVTGLLRAQGIDSQCSAFATPPCASAELSDWLKTQCSVTSVVLHDDIVPRLSLHNLQHLHDEAADVSFDMIKLREARKFEESPAGKAWNDFQKDLESWDQKIKLSVESATGGWLSSLSNSKKQIAAAHKAPPHQVQDARERNLKDDIKDMDEDGSLFGVSFDQGWGKLREMRRDAELRHAEFSRMFEETLNKVPSAPVSIPQRIASAVPGDSQVAALRGHVPGHVVYLHRAGMGDNVQMSAWNVPVGEKATRDEGHPLNSIPLSGSMVNDHKASEYIAALSSLAKE